MHWGSFAVGFLAALFGLPFLQQLLAKAKGGTG